MPTKKELKDYCRKKGIKGYSRLTKAEIEKLIDFHKKKTLKSPDFLEQYQKLKTKEERLLMRVKLQKEIIEKQGELRQLRSSKIKKR